MQVDPRGPRFGAILSTVVLVAALGAAAFAPAGMTGPIHWRRHGAAAP